MLSYNFTVKHLKVSLNFTKWWKLHIQLHEVHKQLVTLPPPQKKNAFEFWLMRPTSKFLVIFCRMWSLVGLLRMHYVSTHNFDETGWFKCKIMNQHTIIAMEKVKQTLEGLVKGYINRSTLQMLTNRPFLKLAHSSTWGWIVLKNNEESG